MSRNRLAVVTGASRGIGKAIAERLASEGYNLAITCKSNTDMLEQVKSSVTSLGADCILYTGDLSYSANVKEFFRIINSRYDSIDILINNAGISHIGLLSDMSDEEWDNIMTNNLNSVFYCCREVIPGMVNHKSGTIINISSVWGVYGASCEVAYSASKGAVNSFTRALAKELAPSNIQVNAVACGLIDTQMNSHLSSEELDDLYEDIPAGRAGTTEEVSDLVYRIAESSSYLTGQIITIDGGWF